MSACKEQGSILIVIMTHLTLQLINNLVEKHFIKVRKLGLALLRYSRLWGYLHFESSLPTHSHHTNELQLKVWNNPNSSIALSFKAIHEKSNFVHSARWLFHQKSYFLKSQVYFGFLQKGKLYQHVLILKARVTVHMMDGKWNKLGTANWLSNSQKVFLSGLSGLFENQRQW